MFAHAIFRFYEELNDFLSNDKRKTAFSYRFPCGSSVKDIIESFGVPHTEIDLILVNSKSVDFTYQVQEGDYVSVYPMFELLDIKPLTHLRPEPLRDTRFIADVHLRRLTKYLRLFGFDTAYDKTWIDAEIVEVAVQQQRIILTRDLGLLKRKKVTHGYFLRETDPKKQLIEVLNYFDLKRRCNPFTRCLECNGEIVELAADDIAFQQVPPRILEYQAQFYRCNQCGRIYWHGTHYDKLRGWVDTVVG